MMGLQRLASDMAAESENGAGMFLRSETNLLISDMHIHSTSTWSKPFLVSPPLDFGMSPVTEIGFLVATKTALTCYR